MNKEQWVRKFTHPKIRLALSAVCAAVTSLVVVVYIQNLKKGYEARDQWTNVWVARTYIPEGVLVQSKHVKKKKVPLAYIQPLVLDADQIDMEKVQLRTRIGILKDEQLTKSKLFNEKNRLNLAWKLPANTQALTIKLSKEDAVGGFVRPGDWVSVWATIQRQPGWPQSQTLMILPRVQVFGVNRDIWKEPRAQKESHLETLDSHEFMVTLNVTTKQAGRLALMSRKSHLQLGLHSSLSDQMERSAPISFEARAGKEW